MNGNSNFLINNIDRKVNPALMLKASHGTAAIEFGKHHYNVDQVSECSLLHVKTIFPRYFGIIKTIHLKTIFPNNFEILGLVVMVRLNVRVTVLL